jgi:hypothetical protein
MVDPPEAPHALSSPFLDAGLETARMDQAGAKHIERVGKLVGHATSIELSCMMWAQALSTDPGAVAAFLAQRVDASAVRKVVRDLARARRPTSIAKLEPLLQRAGAIADIRNLVVHNPLLLPMSDEANPIPVSNLRKTNGASVTDEELQDAIGESCAILLELAELFVQTFGRTMSYDNRVK